ncbi:MAG: PAS domain S-box protein [Candidatus Rokubacteria bacterium]|nr:PAS domain S-box protein [Candidatus Rokubacteria bacterium]MBI3827046.1 PAS domain S-box protein [Candidatus Rokubacteria bacterium]
MTPRPVAYALLVTAVVLALLEALAHTPARLAEPAPIVLLAVTGVAAAWGRTAALWSAGLVVLHALATLGLAGPPTSSTSAAIVRVALLAVIAPALGVLAGTLRDRARRLEADRLREATAQADTLLTALATQRRTEASLREVERRYHLLFERNLAGIYRTTRDGRVLEANDAFARLLGVSRQDVLAMSAREFYVDAADREALLASVRPGAAVSNRQVQWRRADGRTIWVLVNMAEVADGDGTHLEGLVIDVTDRHRAEGAEREVAALQSVARLANAASHEINNPLTALGANLELLRRKVGDDETAVRQIERALEASRRIAEIIARMARITRLEVAETWPGLPPILDLERSSETPPPEAGRD